MYLMVEMILLELLSSCNVQATPVVVSQCKEVPMTMNETTTPHPRLILNNVTPLRNVQTVQELHETRSATELRYHRYIY